MCSPVGFLAGFVAVRDVFASAAAFEGGRSGVAVGASWERHRDGESLGNLLAVIEKELDLDRVLKYNWSCLLLLSSLPRKHIRGIGKASFTAGKNAVVPSTCIY